MPLPIIAKLQRAVILLCVFLASSQACGGCINPGFKYSFLFVPYKEAVLSHFLGLILSQRKRVSIRLALGLERLPVFF